MNWTITGDRPVYLQLIEQLELAIITGQLGPGARVPPVRELAAEAGVNIVCSTPASASVLSALTITAIEETTLSFAIRPEISAMADCQLPKPSGVRSGAIHRPICPRML